MFNTFHWVKNHIRIGLCLHKICKIFYIRSLVMNRLAAIALGHAYI